MQNESVGLLISKAIKNLRMTTAEHYTKQGSRATVQVIPEVGRGYFRKMKLRGYFRQLPVSGNFHKVELVMSKQKTKPTSTTR